MTNTIIASSKGFFYTGIAAGNRLWFGNQYGTVKNVGATARSNHFVGENFGFKLPVAGVSGFNVSSNTFSVPSILNMAYDPTQVSSTAIPMGTLQVNLDSLIFKVAPLVRFYQQFLRRNPDAEGLLSYYRRIASPGTCTYENIRDIALSIISSSEASVFLKNSSAEDIISAFYLGFLNRPAETTGHRAWVAIAKAGDDKKTALIDIAKKFGDSSEFKAMIPLICR